MIEYINQVNNSLNNQVDRLCEDVLMPAVRATYNTSASISVKVASVFSDNVAKRLSNAFYDPLSASAMRRILKPVEWISHNIASHKPKSVPYLLHYFDRSITGMCQNLNGYTKRVNELLAVPKNLKYFIRGLSIERFLLQLNNVSPTVFKGINRVITEIKRFYLALLDLVIKVLDLAFKTVFLGVNFGLFSYLREVIHDARNHLHDKAASRAIDVVEQKETELRKLIVSSAADATADYLVNRITHIAAKSLIGLAVYLPVKTLLTRCTDAPDWSVHVVGATILTKLLWDNVIKPTFDPYYESYDSTYNSEKLSFYELCTYYGIERFYAITSFVGNLFSNEIHIPQTKKASDDEFEDLFPI